jgi:hypothetical protein
MVTGYMLYSLGSISVMGVAGLLLVNIVRICFVDTPDVFFFLFLGSNVQGQKQSSSSSLPPSS